MGQSTGRLTWFLQQVSDLKRMGGWGGWSALDEDKQHVFVSDANPSCKTTLVRQSGTWDHGWVSDDTEELLYIVSAM